ncbi:SsrA-binding protein [Polystyrenella longa]|uniref:SsrA-binding protein n=1 Tax=Polystyrenella longa TaxID=2528007 RepID=A0A518CM35_9PLAN|nr:SsrA-binding protein SmpB [Polystyrenella longa]QDU80300.1 SsrA-binding protein [Polystyrenella longa]
MAKSKTKKKQKKGEDPNSRVVCRNRRARHDYDIIDTLECGVELRGSEVKSIRNSKISIEESFARVENNEVWLLNADIAEYPQATVMNHMPRRPRKLLLKKREIDKFAETAQHDGLTLVPLQVHFTRGLVKVLLAIGKGRKEHDKRDKLKTLADKREIRNAMRH